MTRERLSPAKPAVLLLGTSPLGVRALARLKLPFDLLALPTESVENLPVSPRRLDRLPFDAHPEAVLTVRPAHDIAAIVSFTELGLWPAALLAREHAVRGVPIRGVALTRNKLATRLALSGLVKQPRFGLVGLDAIPAGIDSVVVKPVGGTAGKGVVRVSTASIRDATAEACQLWEEYVAGPEVSVETVTRDDGESRVDVIGVTAKQTTDGPYFVELGHSAPAALEPDDLAEVLDVVQRALPALGISLGPAHTEVKLTADGPVLIEVQTRPGGGRIPALHELVSGVDHYEASLCALLGHTPPMPRRTKNEAAAVTMLRESPISHRIPPAMVPPAAARLLEWEVWPGKTRSGDLQSNLDRHGYLLAAGDSIKAVQQLLHTAVRRLTE